MIVRQGLEVLKRKKSAQMFAGENKAIIPALVKFTAGHQILETLFITQLCVLKHFDVFNINPT